MARIYLAGSSRELDRCETALAEIRAAGHAITEDWCAVMRSAGPDAECTIDVLHAAAIDDVRGVREADWFILLAPLEGSSFGAGFELGVAFAEGVASIWVGEPKGPFAQLANHRYPTLSAALGHIGAVEASIAIERRERVSV